MTLLSCGTETLDTSLSGSPLTAEQGPAGTTPPTTVASIPSSALHPSRPAPAPSTTVAGVALLGGGGTPATTTSTSTTVPPVVWPSAVEGWRPYVAVWFRPEHVDLVLGLIACESSGDPHAYNDTPAANGMNAAGLLQHLDGYWPSRAKKAAGAGYRNAGDIWNPLDQLAVSAWLAYRTPQGFGHWECHREEAA